MNVEHDGRAGQVQQIRITRHILRVVTQPFPAVVGRGKPDALQQGAPGSVEYRDALAEQLPQGLACSRRW